MILNLLNTIALAIGIGTSVNNTNFNYEKKSHRNAVTTYEDTKNYELVGTNIYGVDTIEQHEVTRNCYKYAIDGNYNYSNSIGVLNNTTYSIYGSSNENNYTYNYAALVQVIKINNYRDVGINITINTTLPLQFNEYLATDINIFGGFNLNLDDYLGLTNYKVSTTYKQVYQIASQHTQLYHEYNIEYYNAEATENVGTGSIAMPSNSTYTVAFLMYYATNSYNNLIDNQIVPTNYWCTATWEEENINQEVVDIPGLMFTVLTLPFSFISQAFNLTIFPGTPYQINFTNLFMTVIAIFVLLWLIKHIFK